MTDKSATQGCSLRQTPDCSIARSGAPATASKNRVRPSCECCGTLHQVRKQASPRHGYRCPHCKDDDHLMRLVRAAWPLLNLTNLGETLYGAPPMAIQQLRALFRAHPELHQFQLEGYKRVVFKSMEILFQHGAVEEEAARACGITLFQLRTLLKGRPALRHQADQNYLRRSLDQMGPVFNLVEREGHSIWSACRVLGIRGVRAVYKVAHSDLARERYPSLTAGPAGR